jgi:predicted nucleic acid-binding protein
MVTNFLTTDKKLLKLEIENISILNPIDFLAVMEKENE